MYTSNRRNFIKKVTASGILSLSIPEIVLSAFAADSAAGKISLKKDDAILFQGDSITDAGRDKNSTTFNDPKTLGSGYAFLASAELLHQHPTKNLKIYNKGISGNKVYQLAESWNTDCLQLKPTILSVMIGVNDFWHTLDFGYKGTIETYRNDLVALLERTKQALPGIQFIIGEPFAVPGIKYVTKKWYPAFTEYQKTSKEIAQQFGAVFIPYQKVFDQAQEAAPGLYWTSDGIHPTLAGSGLMAHAWLRATKNA